MFNNYKRGWTSSLTVLREGPKMIKKKKKADLSTAGKRQAIRYTVPLEALRQMEKDGFNKSTRQL